MLEDDDVLEGYWNVLFGMPSARRVSNILKRKLVTPSTRKFDEYT